MAGLTRMNSLVVAVIVVAMTASFVTEAQTLPPCVQKLMGCADSLNTTTTPPETCCAPLKEALTNELPCLCKLYTNTDLLKSFNINVTQAMEMPGRCGISVSFDVCTASAPSPGPSSSVGKIAATGFFSSVMILVSAMLF
ncbi:non-specific lipid transfer protein GPI-anchored 7 isoform X2 [Daucus carota subsp. sativus]|uniref:Bifunctional inhibitor/plant lipid transfer protein/seed storage helical domain-containing protein n=1 Tax=Daucus carota subsp. sativus TaxID=79200 RepID=A0A166FCQ1_DAUCS